MADLFSNVPIPQPLDPLQKPKASDSPLVSILTNQRARQFEAFKIAEQARIDDMNTLAGFDIGKLGKAFGGLFQAQVDRARDMMLAGGMTPAQQKSLVLDLVRDYNKYMTVHVNPFNEAYGIHSNLSTNPQMLDQYNKTLPVGQQYNPMSIEDLAITKDNMMNRVFDPDSIVFDENGNVTVVDEITGKRVKPEMVTNVGGDYNSLFKNQIQPTDIGTLYDWAEGLSQDIISRKGIYNEEAANNYFDLNIGLNNRVGATHRAQLLDTYENEIGGDYMTDDERAAFINMDATKDSYGSLFDSNGMAIKDGKADVLMGDKGHDLWKKATYFEAKPDAQRRQAADDYRARNLLINSGREDKMPVYNVPSTARLIGKVGDDTTIPLIINGEVQYAIPQYHYIDAQGRNVLRASVGTGSDDLSTSFGGGSLTMRTEDIVLDGVNYDAVDQYVRAMHGGATLEDLKAGKLPEASDNTGSPLNNLWGSLDSEAPVQAGDAEVFPVEMATGSDGSTYRPGFQVSQERYDSALSAVRAAFRETPESREMFSAQPSLFAGISNPNMTADKNLETLVKDLVDAGYNDSQISTAMATPGFYDELRKIGYTPSGGGLTDRLRRLLSSFLDAVVPGYESAMSSQRREAKRVAEETIESMATPDNAPDYTTPNQ